MKVVINCTHGGFALATNELENYYRLKGIKEFFCYAQCHEQEGYYKTVNKEDYNNPFAAMMLNVLTKDFGEMAKITQEEPERYSLSRFEIERTDLDLIKTIEDLEPNPHSTLKVVEIPDDVQWTIEEYDGVEWVAEVHRIWD